MMKTALVIFLVLPLLAGCAQTFGATEGGAIPPRPEHSTYPNWQHFCTIVDRSNLGETLNEAGKSGWELVNVDAQGLACFKRPVAFVAIAAAPAAAPAAPR